MLEVEGVSKSSAASAPSRNASLTIGAGEIHALIGPNGAGKTTLFNLVSGLFPPDSGSVRLNGRAIHGAAARTDLPAAASRARSRSPTCSAACRSTRTCGCRCRRSMPARFNVWRDIDSYPRDPRRDRRADQLPRPRGHRGDRRRRAVLWRPAAGRSRHRARLQAAGAAAGRAARRPCRRRARARVEPVKNVAAQHPGADRRARHRPRARLLASASP